MWQPMETAPTDGTQILVYEQTAGICVMFFMDGKFREKVSMCTLRHEPRFWMQLPDLPANSILGREQQKEEE